MNESVEEPKEKKKSLRKKLGPVIFCIGLIIVVVSILLTIPVSALPTSTPDGSLNIVLGFGIVLIFYGFFASLFPDGKGEDWYWVAKMGYNPK